MNIKDFFKDKATREQEKKDERRLNDAMDNFRASIGGSNAAVDGVGYYAPRGNIGQAIGGSYPVPMSPPKPDPSFTLTVTKVENGYALHVNGLGGDARQYIAADLEAIQRIVAQLVGEKGLEMAG